MMFCSVLVILASISYGQSYDLPAVCEDNPICSFVFKDNPVVQIKQCYDYGTFQTCCATCKDLIGKLGNTDSACPWGDAGSGVLKSVGRMNCADLTLAECYYCSVGQPFRSNCCQTCADTCPDTQ